MLQMVMRPSIERPRIVGPRYSTRTAVGFRDRSSAARTPPRVGTLWSIVATERSGRRTLRPASLKPSKAWGEVTSWTRCRSTKSRSGSPSAERTTWASHSFWARVLAWFGIGNDNFPHDQGRKFVPWTQSGRGSGSLTSTTSWPSHRACSYSSLDSWALLASKRGRARTSQNRKIDRKSPRPKGGGFLIFEAKGARQTLTGADMILEALEREGVEYIFGYPGGANLPIYQHLPEHPKLKHILVRHEQGAAHMADGYARASGKPGVVSATSGPGALNLVTGLCTAYMDSVPMIAITGQVISTQVGRDAFQESDVIGATSSVTKHSYLVTKIDQLPRSIHAASPIAPRGRPGPVLIDICKDVQQADAERVTPERLQIPGYRLNGHVDLGHARQAAQALSRAERPVILAGHGVLLSHAEAQLQELAEAAASPVGTTLLGIGAFPVKHPLSLHMTGFMGTGWNLKAVQDADLLMMVGMRVDDRVTARLAGFAPKVKTFIHIDIDGSEMGKNVRPHIELVADAKQALEAMLPHIDHLDAGRSTWLNQIDGWRGEPPPRCKEFEGRLQPQAVR